MKKFFPLILALICVLGFSCCVVKWYKRFPQIDAQRVEKITVWSYTARQQLDSDEIDKFIQMYRSSQYNGNGTGEGGTPEFGASVYYIDGSVLHVNDFQTMGRDFEVTLFDATGKREVWCYINNQALLEYLSMLVVSPYRE